MLRRMAIRLNWWGRPSVHPITPLAPDNLPFSDIAHAQNFRYSYLREKSARAARQPWQDVGAGEHAAERGGDMADGEVFTAGTGQGLVVSTGILGDLVLPEGTFDPGRADEIRELAAQVFTPPRRAGRARCAPTARPGASTTPGAPASACRPLAAIPGCSACTSPALSRELGRRAEALSFWQLSRSSGRSIPIGPGLGPEGAQGAAGNQMALEVEGVVGGGMH